MVIPFVYSILNFEIVVACAILTYYAGEVPMIKKRNKPSVRFPRIEC